MTSRDTQPGENPRRGRGDLGVLIEHLAAGSTVDYAARQARMSRETAHRRLRDPAVIARLNERRSDRVRVISAATDVVAANALAILDEIMRDRNVPPGVRVRAADSVLGKVLSMQTAAVLNERLAVLEAEVERLTEVGGEFG